MAKSILLVFSALLLMGWFSPEISDPDFWWHLKTGQYIVEHRVLPVPDPFAYTTASAGNAYPGEERTRYFNLTHEWLAQAAFYAGYRLAGFAGIVLTRAAMLTAFCALVGLVAYGRSGGFHRAVAAGLAAAGAAGPFAADRPYVITFFMLAALIALLEFRRALWLVVPLLVIWANCHGGYLLGWAVLAAYCAANYRDRRLWTIAAIAVAASGFNPNGYRVPLILWQYRSSFMQSRLLEWAPPAVWPPHWWTVLLAAAAAMLIWARRQVRAVDWLLLALFSAAALSASRNTFLAGLICPILLVSYWKPPKRFRVPAFTAPGIVAALLLMGLTRGTFFQLRAADWAYPAGAADFLLAHHIDGRLFNTYEYGGFLIWRLWPQQRVFIDGRALSDRLFLDYARILYNHDASGGKSAAELLDQYGADVILMNAFEYVTGNAYLLAPALADPRQTTWKLVYDDPQAMIFMRHPPSGVPPIDSLRVLAHLEAECSLHLDHKPEFPRCARSLGQIFSKVGDFARARRWLGAYLALPHPSDVEAEDAYRRMMQAP